MLHPLQSIPERKYKWVFLPLLGLTIMLKTYIFNHKD